MLHKGVALLLLAGLEVACAGVGAKPSMTGGAGGGSGGGGGSSGGGGAGDTSDSGSGGAGGAPQTFPPLTDFPPDPIFVDPTIPPGAPGLFAGSSSRAGSAPCITSPGAGTLMPRNWLRPRITYQPAASENLFEVTLAIAGFAHALRAYTRDSSYTLDRDLWNSLRTSINDMPVTVTVRALQIDGNDAVQLPVSEPAASNFVVAPVDAPGKIVYWALTSNTGSLKGFGIGEEGTESVLTIDQVQARTSTEICIGCHSATPDGNAVGIQLGEGFYFDSIADIRTGMAGATPAYVTSTALATIRSMAGMPAYSPAHWSDGDRIVLLSDVGDLTWVQLDGTRHGVLARTGDANLATEPAFRHDGTGVVYVSTADSIVQGRLAAGPADLYAVPYAGGAGGPATKIAGASDPDYTEYYPALSADDALLAFTRVGGAGSVNVYSNADAEVWVVPAGGGVAQRLVANDAPACQTDLQSPGLTNDWPKWSPDVGKANGKSYYWLTFSSQRSGAAQIYVSGLVVDDAGGITTYPALHLWNQPPDEGNHSPSWDNFQIPPIIVP